MTPRIGITTHHFRDPERGTLSCGIPQSYVAAIHAAGGVPLLLPLVSDQHTLRVFFDSVDALLFPGGADVHPRFYGEHPHEHLGPTEELRDEVEITLCRWAFTEDKPVMGLCRGIQLMNVALGGTLIQDLPSQRQTTLNHRQSHHCTSETSHTIELTPDSLLARTVDAQSLPVNSFHHQAIERVARGLVVVGSSEDGIVEAVEATGKRFFVGLQCHPEHLWDKTDSKWRKIFSAFVEAARSSARSPV